ncbi:hypothetical protein LshimejAT787_0503620 [Lyophyllum shimeji]|uniref:Uncharacterized protein n=1 Tax=Lyophyllum shimeji TaxID=47721 RepID=A0A9P3PLG0_LYOSH|nr:hypothetical protein LshimejAT787_0503620 [Lyophyllum shimeji]
MMRSCFVASLFACLPLFGVQALPTSYIAKNDTHLFRRGGITEKDLLLSCPGAAGSPNVQRADRCTLVNIRNNPDQIKWKNIGNPQLNCAGGTGPTHVTLGGTTSISKTTSVNANFGISFDGISIGGGVDSSETKTQELSRSTEYDVPPGRQAVYTAGYTFHSQTGNVQINYGDRVNGHYIWFTGVTVTKLIPDNNIAPRFEVHESKCGTDPNDLNNHS